MEIIVIEWQVQVEEPLGLRYKPPWLRVALRRVRGPERLRVGYG
jgi:hypothetical protein